MRQLDDVVAALADLVLPSACAGCGARGQPVVCADCAEELADAQPYRTRPTPAPPGFPPCVAFGVYDGVLRELLLAYKERGRHDAARPLGAMLADVVAGALGHRRPVLLVPVPATARAARQRYGDHVYRLARIAARTLRAQGWPAQPVGVLQAMPRPDSADLDSAARLEVAAGSFRVRAQRLPVLRRAIAAGAAVVLVDDIVTTGATLAAIATRLGDTGFPVTHAAVIASTRRRHTVAE